MRQRPHTLPTLPTSVAAVGVGGQPVFLGDPLRLGPNPGTGGAGIKAEVTPVQAPPVSPTCGTRVGAQPPLGSRRIKEISAAATALFTQVLLIFRVYVGCLAGFAAFAIPQVAR